MQAEQNFRLGDRIYYLHENSPKLCRVYGLRPGLSGMMDVSAVDVENADSYTGVCTKFITADHISLVDSHVMDSQVTIAYSQQSDPDAKSPVQKEQLDLATFDLGFDLGSSDDETPEHAEQGLSPDTALLLNQLEEPDSDLDDIDKSGPQTIDAELVCQPTRGKFTIASYLTVVDADDSVADNQVAGTTTSIGLGDYPCNPGSQALKRRFATVTQHDVESLANARKAHATDPNTKWGVKIMKGVVTVGGVFPMGTMEGIEHTTGSELTDIIQVKVKKTKIGIEDRKNSEGSGTIRIKLKNSKSKVKPKSSHSVDSVDSESCVDNESTDVSKPETIKILVPSRDGSEYELVPIVLLDKPKCKIKNKSHGAEKQKQKEKSVPATVSVEQGKMKQSFDCIRSAKPESESVILSVSKPSSTSSCGREQLKKTIKTEPRLFSSEKENQLPQVIFSGGHMFQSASTMVPKDKQNTVNLVKIKEENPKVKLERKPLVDVDQKVIDVKPVTYRDLACVGERNRARAKAARTRKTNPVIRKIRPPTLRDIYAKKIDCDDGFHNVDDDLQDLQHILKFDARKLIPIELRLTDGSTDGSTNDDEDDLYRYHFNSGMILEFANKSYPRRSKKTKTKKPKSKKPDLGLAKLIEMALLNSAEEKLTLNSICDWIMGRFPYYKELDENKWRPYLRSKLTLSSRFQKVEKAKWGWYWGFSDADYSKSKIVKQNSCHWKKRKIAEYEKTSTPDHRHIFNLRPGRFGMKVFSSSGKPVRRRKRSLGNRVKSDTTRTTTISDRASTLYPLTQSGGTMQIGGMPQTNGIAQTGGMNIENISSVDVHIESTGDFTGSGCDTLNSMVYSVPSSLKGKPPLGEINEMDACAEDAARLSEELCKIFHQQGPAVPCSTASHRTVESSKKPAVSMAVATKPLPAASPSNLTWQPILMDSSVEDQNIFDQNYSYPPVSTQVPMYGSTFLPIDDWNFEDLLQFPQPPFS